MTSTQNAADRFAGGVVKAWTGAIASLDKQFASFSHDELQQEIAPGKNRVFYLLGHLTAVHDRMLPLLRLGDRLHPELDQPFLTDADRKSPDQISAAALRKAWADVNAKLNAAVVALPAEDWLTRHDAVSEEDFAKEPTRNRLSVLMSRTAHAGFHSGQLALVVKKK
jgi:hypothetical protein